MRKLNDDVEEDNDFLKMELNIIFVDVENKFFVVFELEVVVVLVFYVIKFEIIEGNGFLFIFIYLWFCN